MIIDFSNLGGGGGGGSYTLPTATSNRLGGVKIGDGISVQNDGTISVNDEDFVLWQEQETGNMAIMSDGMLEISSIGEDDNENPTYNSIVLSSEDNSIYHYVKEMDPETGDYSEDAKRILTEDDLAVATTATTGLVKIGSGITVDSAGTISVSSQGGGGDATVLQSVSGLPSAATNGDVMSLAGEKESLGVGNVYVDQNNDGNWRQAFWDMGQEYIMEPDGIVKFERGNAEPVYEYPDGQLILMLYINEYDYNFWVYLTSGDTYNVSFVDISQTEELSLTGSTSHTFTFGDGDEHSVEFYLDEDNNLYATTDVTYRVIRAAVSNYSKMYDSSLWVYSDNTDGEDSMVCIKEFRPTSDGMYKNIVIAYYGELPTNEILFQMDHTSYWGGQYSYLWLADDGYFWIANNTGMTDGERMFTFGETKDYSSYYRITASEGLISIAVRELGQLMFSTYGDWYKFNGGHFQPTGWNEKCKNLVQYAYKYPFANITINGNTVKFAGESDLPSIVGPNSWGQIGQVLTSKGNGQTPVWSALQPEIQVVDSLPVVAKDGSVVIVNTGASYTASTAFTSFASTNYSDRNNFSDDIEIGWYEDGNNCIYFGNGNLTSTAKTFLYRIAMRTSGDGDWNTSQLAYINVFREYDSVGQTHFYSWDMPEFSGYSTSGVIDSNTTSADTEYLPIWTNEYGYKFHFELFEGGLAMWMRNSDVDSGDPDSSWGEGESYGDVPFTCRNHTTEFYNGIDTEGKESEFYTFKGGVWYKLGISLWKGTQAQYDAMSGTGYSNSTLYTITPSNN